MTYQKMPGDVQEILEPFPMNMNVKLWRAWRDQRMEEWKMICPEKIIAGCPVAMAIVELKPYRRDLDG